MVNIIQAITVALVAGMADQFLSLWAEIDLFDGIEREVFCGEDTCVFALSLPGMDAILESLLLCKAFISFAELDIGDISIQALLEDSDKALEFIQKLADIPEILRTKTVLVPRILKNTYEWLPPEADFCSNE